MQLTTALSAAAARAHANAPPAGVPSNARAEELVAVADDRAAALQRRLAEAESEMARMEGEVAAAKKAVDSREGEVKRLYGLLEGGRDVDLLALKAQAQTKDDLVMSLTQQAEHLTQRVQELEKAEKRVEAAVHAAESGAAAASEAEVKEQNQALVAQLAEVKAVLAARDAQSRRGDADASDDLAAAMSQAAALRRELTEVAAARDDADVTYLQAIDAVEQRGPVGGVTQQYVLHQDVRGVGDRQEARTVFLVHQLSGARLEQNHDHGKKTCYNKSRLQQKQRATSQGPVMQRALDCSHAWHT